MRTLLNESLPPHAAGEPAFSGAESVTPALRTFSQNPVLDNLDNLVEVGLGGAVIATPGAGAGQAHPAPERGRTLSETPGHAEPVRPAFPNAVTPIV
jgi:hypothetical protein